MFQNNKDDNVKSLTNVDAFTCAVGVDDYTMYSKSSSLQVVNYYKTCFTLARKKKKQFWKLDII